MPIYEYVCTKCGHEWDTIQKFSEKPLTTCPRCSKKTAKRKISAAAFHLKGSGWYVTDYKKDGGKAKDTDSKEEAKPADTDKSETKTDATETAKETPKKETSKPAKKASKKSKSASA